jgi:hypothetical protein
MAPAKLQPALLGGVVIGVLSALPLVSVGNCCCCAWILFGGGLAAYLMQQGHPEPIAIGDGVMVGLLAGLVGAVVTGIVSIPIGFLMGPFQADMFRGMASNADLPPELRRMLEPFGEGQTVASIILGFIVMLVICPLFGMLGGLFGALLFRKNPTAVIPPPIPPQGF